MLVWIFYIPIDKLMPIIIALDIIIGMDEVLIIAILFALGAGVGSFIDTVVYRTGKRQSILRGRSRCEKCKHKLSGTDLIPVLGWVARRGRCCYCGMRVSPESFFVELVTAFLFATSYALWPGGINGWTGIILFVLWLMILSGLVALAIYDYKYTKLPNKIICPTLIIAAFYWAISGISNGEITDINHFLDLVLAMLPIAGIYGLIYLSSHGEKVGLGDVKLGAIIGFLLPWQAGMAVLFLANVLLLIAYLLISKIRNTKQISLGPALITATIIIFLCYETFRGFL